MNITGSLGAPVSAATQAARTALTLLAPREDVAAKEQTATSQRGALVKVRSLDESLALEGAWINDIHGNAVPDTPENRAALEKALAKKAEADAATAAAGGVAATQG